MHTAIRNAIAVSAITLGFSGIAAALPVTYSFSATGPVAAGNAGVGLLPPDVEVAGTFVYDADAVMLPGTGVFGGVTYQSVNDIRGSVGGREWFDAVSGVEVRDGRDQFGELDLLVIISSHVGGDWSTFRIGSLELVRVYMIWQEDPALGHPDFLNGNNLPSALPNFTGELLMEFGSDRNTVTGHVLIRNLLARPVTVSETQSLSLLAAGLIPLVALRRRKSIA